MNKKTMIRLLALSSFCSIGTMNTATSTNRGVCLPSGEIYCPAQNKVVASVEDLGPQQGRYGSGCGRGYARGPRDGRGNGPRDGRGRTNDSHQRGRGYKRGPQDGRGNGPRDGSGRGCRS